MLLLLTVVVVVVVVVEVGWVPLSLLPSEQAILAGAIPKPQGRSTEFAERSAEGLPHRIAVVHGCTRLPVDPLSPLLIFQFFVIFLSLDSRSTDG